MNNKILLNFPNAVFMPYIPTEQDMPCYYSFFNRVTRIDHPGQCNFHKNLEIFYLIHGSTDMVYEGKTVSLHAGDVMVINSYCVHQLIMKEPIGYLSLIADDDFCMQNKIDISTLHFKEVIRDKQLNELLENVIKEHDMQDDFRYTGVRLALLEVLVFLCRNYASKRSAKEMEADAGWRYVRHGIEYIKENFTRKLSVDEIAANVGLSKYHFIREFKRLTGYTLTSYINIIRCEYAKELLQVSQVRIKDVAFQCGFENESYFTSVFRRCTGILPSEFIRSVTMPE